MQQPVGTGFDFDIKGARGRFGPNRGIPKYRTGRGLRRIISRDPTPGCGAPPLSRADLEPWLDGYLPYA